MGLGDVPSGVAVKGRTARVMALAGLLTDARIAAVRFAGVCQEETATSRGGRSKDLPKAYGVGLGQVLTMAKDVAADDVKAGPSPGKGLDRQGETRPYLAMLARADGAPNPNAGELRSRDRTRRGTGPFGLLCGDSSVERTVERFVVEFFDCSCVEKWSTLGSTRRGA